MYQDKANRKRRAGKSPRPTTQPEVANPPAPAAAEGEPQRTASRLLN
jgi:hypothetical protein